MIEVKFHSVSSTRGTVIKQLEKTIATLKKDLMTVKERKERWVNLYQAPL